ncbi:MAG: hypothetical protein AAF480_17290 [Actinomycetota bacterium]
MPSTRDVLVDAAERLVRDRGLDALTIRSLAAETNYGKSTVHSTVGGIGALTDELASRARGDMIRATAGGTARQPEDPAWRKAAFERLAAWIIQNPHWAELGFRPIPDRSFAPMLTDAVPDLGGILADEDQAALVLMASARMSSTLPLIIHVDDTGYGGQLLDEAVKGITGAFRDLIALRSTSDPP